LAQFLPVLLLGLPAGQAADTFSRKYLLAAAHVTMLLASLGLAAVSLTQGPVDLILVFLALAGCSRAIGMPTRSSLIPLVVPVEAVGNAVSWTSSGWQMARVVGSTLGGVLIAATKLPFVAYGATTASLVVCIGLVVMIRLRPMPTFTEPRTLRTLLAGVRFVWQTELLLAAILLDFFAVLLGGATALLPMFAEEILHVGAVGFGFLRAAESIGAIAMAMIVAHRPPMQRPGRALLWSVAGFGVTIVVFGLSEDFTLSFIMLLLMGGLDNISVVIRGTLVQMLTPDHMRGRVGAVNSVFISSTNQLGAFESGITAAWGAMLTGSKVLGAKGAVVFGGIGTLVVVAVVAGYWPRLRRLGPLHEVNAEGQK
jgi:MFS family permease